MNANTIITDIDSRSITASVDHSTILEEEKTNTKSNWLTYIWGDIYATDNPNQYSQKKKNVIILLVALGGLCGPLSSMMYMPGILAVAADLNTSISSVNGTISAYVVFMGISPLFWAALSDTYGRKRMYIVSGIINVISSIICAFSRNIGMLVVFRAIQSFGANAGLTLGAGVIADCISMEVRGKAYGGFLCEYLNWQSTFYFTAVMAGVLLIMSAAFLPETLRKKRVVFEKSIDKDENPVVIEDKPPSFLDTLKVSFKPMVVMLYDPTNPTITDTFKRIYGYTEWQVGLCYLAMGAGFMIGSVLSGQYSDYVLRKLSEQKEPGHQIVSEMRLQAAVPSFFLIPAGYLIYGWSTEKGVGVYAPLIGLFLYALGQMWAFTPTSVYLVDSKPGYSATAVGVNSCVRCLVAAITTAFSADAVHAVGTGVLFTILAVINVLNCGFVIVCYLYGYKWRLKFEEKHMPELYEISMRKTQVKKVELLEKKEDGIERIQTQHSACYSIA
ncbi:major facilitator superfamily domain-containing protein [Thamnidium elegans]|nr:major facilitator superfamily domain-containing protein [Thamnidium elegans]